MMAVAARVQAILARTPARRARDQVRQTRQAKAEVVRTLKALAAPARGVRVLEVPVLDPAARVQARVEVVEAGAVAVAVAVKTKLNH